MDIWLLILCLLCTLGYSLAFLGFNSLYNNHQEPEVNFDEYKSSTQFEVDEKWLLQKLDHFNPNENRMWKMRYLENDRYFKPNGPIFIFIGGEWEISEGWLLSGHMFDMAKELNGKMLYTEHRYYGKSQPTKDTSPENLKYLTVEQALNDLAHFIEHIKSSSNDFERSGVILVGASYSATLATWARLKFPHLVSGSWASSAPLYAKMNFYEYNEEMTESIRLVGGEKCLQRFASAFKKLEDFAAYSEPKVIVKIFKDFRLCAPLKLCRDIAHFFYELSDTVAGLVQTHKSGDIEKACAFILDEKHEDEVAALGAWMNSKNKTKCLDMNYNHAVEKLRNDTWGSDANKQLRQWTYQTCKDFGWYATSSSGNQIFGTKHPKIEYFIQMCSDIFNSDFNRHTIEKNIEKTNMDYGGLKPDVSNVYSTHGQIDPWRAVGLSADINEDSPTVILPMQSHVSDLWSITDMDTEHLRISKERVRKQVKKWLKI